MRLKTNRRLILLAVALAVLGAAAFALYFVRNWQKDRMTDGFFAQGQKAFQEHRYYPALTNTAQYLSRVKNKPAEQRTPRYTDALLTYAESRRLIEENDDHNIAEAIPWYIQYRDRRPDDAAVLQTLLESYNRIGRFVEARDLAKKALPKDLAQAKQSDIPILRERAIALRSLAKTELTDPDLLAATDALLRLAPLDVHAALLRLEIDANTGHKTEARARAEQLLKDHPDDPAACLIAAYSREIDPKGADLQERHQLLCRAAGLDPRTAARVKPVSYTDERFILQLAVAFDSARAFDFSAAVLEDGADRTKSQIVQRLVVRRLWQDNENEKALQRTAGLDPANPESSAELLGFRALCLQRTGKSDEAAAITKTLAAREGDFRAGGWGAAIPLVDPASQLKPAEAASAWKAIVNQKNNPGEPVFQAFYGAALAGAGRMDEARAAWQNARAIPVAASWFLPALRIADSLLAEGRVDEAAKAADDARSVAPNRAAVVVSWFEAHAARIQKGSTVGPAPAQALADLEEALPKLAQAVSGDSGRELTDRLLVPHVLLLARANRLDDAKRIAREAIAREPAPAAEVLQRLASVSASEHLGLEADAMRRVEATAGQTASVLFVRATDLAAAGKPGEGLAVLRDAANAKPTDLSIKMALARYLERIGRPGATEAWVAIGDAAPNDLAIQRACLQAPTAAGNAAFIERTIQRYTTLTGAATGSEDSLTRSAEARAAMWGRPGKADRDRAAAAMAEVVKGQPQAIEPKVLLADVLSYSDPSRDVRPDYQRAASQLADALAIEPRNVAIGLQLARVLQQDRQFERARGVLVPIAADAAGEAPNRRAAAELLINQGEPGPVASDALADLASKAGDQVQPSLLVVLAEAYLAQREDAKAAALYARLAGGAATDADSVYMTARYYALHNDSAKSAAAIARLDALQLEPGIKEYALARLAGDAGDASATTHYEAAVAAAPKRSDIWRQYFQSLIRAGKYADAQGIAERAAKAIPDDPSLAALAEQARMFASGNGNVDLQALIKAMAADPAQAEAAEALRALDAAAARGEAESPDSLVAIADKYSTCVPIQLFVARRLIRIAPDRAVVVARRAMTISPTDPAPAKAAAEMYLAQGRWADMLTASLEWQKRDTTRSVEADLAVAEAYLRLGQFDKGLAVLTPRVAQAQSAPAAPNAMGVLNIQARLLLATGKEAEARALLSPQLATSADWRIGVWLAIAVESAPTLPVAQTWINQLLPAVPADAVNERLAVASGYTTLAGRFHDADSVKQALAILDALTQDPKTATAAAWESLGVVHHSRNDLAAAEAAYRKALALDPKRSIALNNLASILAESQGKLDDALVLAKSAVDVDPNPNSLDTLAGVHTAIARRKQDAGDAPGASQEFHEAASILRRAAALDPLNPRPLMNAAKNYEDAKDPAQAADVYEAILKVEGLSPDFTAAARNNLAMSLVRLNRSKADLDRAIANASAATQASDHPAFLDTLGWCQLAAGQVTDAKVTFRQALDRAASRTPKINLPASAIGLATILAAGTPEDRTQAKTLLDAIDPKTLDAEDAARYQAARALLSKAP